MLRDRFGLKAKQRSSLSLRLSTAITCLPFFLAVFVLILVIWDVSDTRNTEPGVVGALLFGFTFGAVLAITQIKAVFFDNVKAAVSIAAFYWLVFSISVLSMIKTSIHGMGEGEIDDPQFFFLLISIILVTSAFIGATMRRHVRVLRTVMRRNSCRR